MPRDAGRTVLNDHTHVLLRRNPCDYHEGRALRLGMQRIASCIKGLATTSKCKHNSENDGAISCHFVLSVGDPPRWRPERNTSATAWQSGWNVRLFTAQALALDTLNLVLALPLQSDKERRRIGGDLSGGVHAGLQFCWGPACGGGRWTWTAWGDPSGDVNMLVSHRRRQQPNCI